MPGAKRRPIRRARKHATAVPWGIYSYLLGLPYDPIKDVGTGRLECYLHTREELIETYWPALTDAERRRAMEIKSTW